MSALAHMSLTEFSKRAAIVIALAFTPILIWLLFDAILIIVGAILFALLLDVVAQPFRFLGLPRGVALVLSGILVVSVLGGAGYLFGKGAFAEMQEVLLRAGRPKKSSCGRCKSWSWERRCSLTCWETIFRSLISSASCFASA